MEGGCAVRHVVNAGVFRSLIDDRLITNFFSFYALTPGNGPAFALKISTLIM